MTGTDQAEKLSKRSIESLNEMLAKFAPSSDEYNTILRAVSLKRKQADVPPVGPSDITN